MIDFKMNSFLLELQFAPLDDELGDRFQLLAQRDRAAGVVLPVLTRRRRRR